MQKGFSVNTEHNRRWLTLNFVNKDVKKKSGMFLSTASVQMIPPSKLRFTDIQSHSHKHSQINVIELIRHINTHYKMATNPCLSFCRADWTVTGISTSAESPLSSRWCSYITNAFPRGVELFILRSQQLWSNGCSPRVMLLSVQYNKIITCNGWDLF